jgi:hypothetical protein
LARDRSRSPVDRVRDVQFEFFGDMQLNVQTPTGKNIALDVHVADTIDSVKAKICSGAKIWGDDLHLVVKLKGGSKLSDYNLPNGCTLHLVKTSFRIRVRPPGGGQQLTFDVDASDTIAIVKAKIQAQCNIPSYLQCLYFYSVSVFQPLDHSRTLASYNIEKNTVLQLRLV